MDLDDKKSAAQWIRDHIYMQNVFHSGLPGLHNATHNGITAETFSDESPHVTFKASLAVELEITATASMFFCDMKVT